MSLKKIISITVHQFPQHHENNEIMGHVCVIRKRESQSSTALFHETRRSVKCRSFAEVLKVIERPRVQDEVGETLALLAAEEEYIIEGYLEGSKRWFKVMHASKTSRTHNHLHAISSKNAMIRNLAQTHRETRLALTEMRQDKPLRVHRPGDSNCLRHCPEGGRDREREREREG